MKGWTTKTIGELCDSACGKVQTGPFGSQLHESDYSETGIPFVMPQDIIGGRIDETGIARVSETHVDRLHRHKLSKGDIIYGRRGDIGRQALIRDENVGWLCGSGCIKITLGQSTVIPEFLHRYLQIPEIIRWIEGQAIGATMANLNTSILRRVPVTYPVEIENQRKIAAILSAYDELIENNKRRIALLEKMAEEIYREWFVRLRFPGHEKVKFSKGVPEGWILKRFGEIVEYYIGGGWGEENQSPTFCEGAFVIRGTDIPDIQVGELEGCPYRFHKPSNLKSRTLRPNDFVFEVSGGSKDQLLGRNVLVTERVLNFFKAPVIAASFCKQIRFRTEIVSPYFMKYFMKLYYDCDLVGIYQIQSTGISNYQFESFLKFQTIILPPDKLQTTFENVVNPIVTMRDEVALANIALRKTRDLLLPRLISGKLSVENLDIQFPPGMAEELS